MPERSEEIKQRFEEFLNDKVLNREFNKIPIKPKKIMTLADTQKIIDEETRAQNNA